MLPRRNRLSPVEAKDIKEKASSRFFSLYFRPKKEKTPRFMVVVGSKVHKLTALRNRLKRIMREALRNNPSLVDGVLVALPPANKLAPPEIRQEIKKILIKK